MKHTPTGKPVSLWEARDRAGLTQQELEDASGVDRTRISRLEIDSDRKVLQETYVALDQALRRCGGLKRGERLVFGGQERIAS